MTPVGGAGSNADRGRPARSTFRPPWLKEAPPPMPMPSQPWVKNMRPAQSSDAQDAAGVISKALRTASDCKKTDEAAPATQRKRSSINIVPIVAERNRDESKNYNTSKGSHEPVKISEPEPRQSASIKTVPVNIEKTQNVSVERVLPPPPPPPPPPPSSSNALLNAKAGVKHELSEAKQKVLESLRSRPKRRPDWSNMMKEIEHGAKLTHVVCNDRSAPLIPCVKAKDQGFMYESEQPNIHNQLLKQIASGVNLKPTRTNDRSKPFIEGLRKFRRQMTIEEQIQKSASIASLGLGIAEVEADPLDEVDDIDKVRDDLQSTKQLLALELKNKEALQRENKKLQAKILNLEVEIEKDRNKSGRISRDSADENSQEINELKMGKEIAEKKVEETESQLHDTSTKLELTKIELNDAIQLAQRLEKQLKIAQAANLANVNSLPQKHLSVKKLASMHKIADQNMSLQIDNDEESVDSVESGEESESDSASEMDGGDTDAEKRQARQLQLLARKLKSIKIKREQAIKERTTLKEQMKKYQSALRAEKKKYKVLQKEVDKMSKLINDAENNDEEEDEEEEEEEEEGSLEEASSGETDSDMTESELGDLDSSEDDSQQEETSENLQNRVKKCENVVSSLKKGNYLLKANVERHRDGLNKQKEMALALQEDLNSVLEELG